MNLVTAALVENAMETAAHEAEEERQKLKRRVQSVPWRSFKPSTYNCRPCQACPSVRVSKKPSFRSMMIVLASFL